jgi:hypothetical protein
MWLFCFNCFAEDIEQCSEIVIKNYEKVQCKRVGKYYSKTTKCYYCKNHLPYEKNILYVGRIKSTDSVLTQSM